MSDPAKSPTVSSPKIELPATSNGTAYVSIINFILGIGCFALPYGYAAAGVVLGVAFTALITVLSIITHGWIIEVQLRLAIIRSALTEGLIRVSDDEREKLLESDDSFPLIKNLEPVGDDHAIDNLETRVQSQEDPFGELDRAQVLEIGDMIRVFGGKGLEMAWSISSAVYIFVALWLYVVIIASSLIMVAPLAGTSMMECNANSSDFSADCQTSLRIWLGITLGILVVLLMRNWSWMHYVQKAIVAMFWVLIFVLMVVSLISMYDTPFTTSSSPTSHHAGEHSSSGPHIDGKMVEFSGFSELFGIALFSQVGHFGIPTTLRNVGNIRQSKSIYAAALGTLMALYLMLSIPTALYMGTNMNRQVTLSFATYDKWGPGKSLVVGAIMVALPSLTLATVYQSTIGLCNIIEAALPLSFRIGFAKRVRFVKRVFPCFQQTTDGALNHDDKSPFVNQRDLDDDVSDDEHFYTSIGCGEADNYGYVQNQLFPLQLTLRVSMVLGYVGLSYLSHKFKLVCALIGTIAFIIFFFCPVFLMVMSERATKRLGLPHKTALHNPFTSHLVTCAVLLLFAVGCFIQYIRGELIPSLS